MAVLSLGGSASWAATTSTVQTITGAKTFQASTASATPLAIVGATGQTADLMQWRDGTGTNVIARIGATGEIFEGVNRVFSAGNKPGVADLSATGTRDANSVLRGDNTWLPASTKTAFTNTEPGTSYPVGISYQWAPTADGWPRNGIVETVRDGTTGVVRQTLKDGSATTATASTQFAHRSWQPALATPGWTGWSTTVNNVTAAKSDLITRNSTGAMVRLTVGADGTVLMADSTLNPGLKWVGNMVTTDTAQTLTGQKIFSTASTTTVNAIVRAIASQTANLQEWQNDAGGVLSAVRTNGIAMSGTLQVGMLTDESSQQMLVNNTFGPSDVLTVRGAASQAGNLTTWQNSAGTILARVTSNGHFYTSNLGAGAATPAAGVGVFTEAAAATDRPLLVRGAASQTANLTQWQDSAGNVIASVTAAGKFYAPIFANGSNEWNIMFPEGANDFNVKRPSGIYNMNASANAPTGDPWHLLIQMTHNNTANGYIRQIAFTMTNNDTTMFTRQCNNGVWAAWRAM